MGIEHVLKVKRRGVVGDDATGGEAADNNIKRDDEGETFHLCINKLW